jgi:hypothetical protein
VHVRSYTHTSYACVGSQCCQYKHVRHVCVCVCVCVRSEIRALIESRMAEALAHTTRELKEDESVVPAVRICVCVYVRKRESVCVYADVSVCV